MVLSTIVFEIGFMDHLFLVIWQANKNVFLVCILLLADESQLLKLHIQILNSSYSIKSLFIFRWCYLFIPCSYRDPSLLLLKEMDSSSSSLSTSSSDAENSDTDNDSLGLEDVD